MIRLLPPTAFLGCIVISVVAHVLMPIVHWVLPPWNAVGLPLLVAGLCLPIAGSKMFDQRKTNINTFIDPNHLVTSGLFRYSRNPMYLGFAVALVGVWCLAGSLSAGMGFLIFLCAANAIYIPYEEARCAEVFGEDYLDYKARVRRWF